MELESVTVENKIELSKEEFFEKVRNNDFRSNEKYEVIKHIFINQEIIEKYNYNNSLNISNIDFRESVTFHNFSSLRRIDINNCTFSRNLSFNKLNSINISLRENTIIKEGLYFNSICLNKESKGLDLEILDCEVLEKFNIHKSNILKVNIGSSKFNLDYNDCLFQENNLIGEILLTHNEFNQKTNLSKKLKLIDKLNNGKIYLQDNVFQPNFLIKNLYSESIFINSNTFQKDCFIEFENSQNNQNLNKVILHKSQFNSFILKNHSSIKMKLDFFNIIYSTHHDGNLKVENFHINELFLEGTNKGSLTIFKNSIYSKINFQDFVNKNSLMFQNCEINEKESSLKIIDSDLGDTKFNDFSFKSFKEIQIENSFINEIKTSNVEWFDDEQLTTNSENAFKTQRNKREIYKQLKQALESNGNKIDSLLFKAREKKAYKKELQLSNNAKKEDKLILWVGKINEHGLSWWKATKILLLLNFGFYILFLLVTNEKINLDSFQLYFQLLNPTRKLPTLYGFSEKNPFVTFITFLDIFQRLILGIFYFQIIQAFRKFVGK
ncbi:hypothetical protein [Aureivirga marina]|uniref:hypothetical protein n=1 Tax=Aureivirga marina TaxID=1182451 RepID=UPI0018CA64BE|nr:hypothetical protein [Aureivirga marina]